MYRIEAEVAADPEKLHAGPDAMLAKGAAVGMLFVFTENRAHCMWMKITLIPLSVAFLTSRAGSSTSRTYPQSEDNHCAARPARFALK